MGQPLPPLSPSELNALLSGATPPRLLDVREPPEYVSELGHVPGSELVPLGTLPQSLARFAGETREIVVVCKSGMRAHQAAGFLAQNGLSARVLDGGMLAWNHAQLPT